LRDAESHIDFVIADRCPTCAPRGLRVGMARRHSNGSSQFRSRVSLPSPRSTPRL